MNSEKFPATFIGTKKQEKYHVCNQVQSSKGKNGQKHPKQIQEYFRGILPDQGLYDPAIRHSTIRLNQISNTLMQS